MLESFDLVTIIFLMGATQGIFLAGVLFQRPSNRKANRWLAGLMLAYSLFIAESAISGSPFSFAHPHLLAIAEGAVFLIAPLHYLYAQALIKPDFSFSRRHLLHGAPFALFYLGFLFPFYLKSGAEKIEIYQVHAGSNPPFYITLLSWLILVQGIGYMIVTLRLLKQHKASVKNRYSNLSEVSLNWLQNITILTLGVWIWGVIIEIMQAFEVAGALTATVPVFITILIYVMGYMGMKQPEIFDGPPHISKMSKYERSGLSEQKAKALEQKLAHLMKTQKPYTDSNLKIGELADMLAISTNYLSQVINEQYNQNFF